MLAIEMLKMIALEHPDSEVEFVPQTFDEINPYTHLSNEEFDMYIKPMLEAEANSPNQ